MAIEIKVTVEEAPGSNVGMEVHYDMSKGSEQEKWFAGAVVRLLLKGPEDIGMTKVAILDMTKRKDN